MKQKLLFCLATLVLLSSCAGTGILKRRYTKGYYVSHAKKATEPKQHCKTNHTAVAVQQESLQKPTVTETKPLIGSGHSADTRIIAYSPEIKASAISLPEKRSPQLLTSAKAENLPAKQLQVSPLKLTTVNSARSSADSSKVELILMVILCLFPFINLIPVYLHDNAITLILDFTYIGGVIFALLVVLDVVNLAK